MMQKLSKDEKKELKETIETVTGKKVAGVIDVWSNGKSSRRYIGQDITNQGGRKSDGFKRMVAVYIEVNEDVD